MGNVQIGYATDSWPQPQAICGNQLLHKVKHARRWVVGTVGGSNQSALLALLASSAQQGPPVNQITRFLLPHPSGVATFLIRSSLTQVEQFAVMFRTLNIHMFNYTCTLLYDRAHKGHACINCDATMPYKGSV